MANLSYLFTSTEDAPPNYERDNLVSTGKYILPLFWLSTFQLEDIKQIIDEEGDELPYGHVLAEKAVQTFEKNTKVLDLLSLDLSSHYEKWIQLIDLSYSGYLSFDPSEIIFMVNTDPNRLYKAIEFFTDQTDNTLAALFDLTCFPDVLNEEMRLREFAVVAETQTSIPVEEYLMGYVVTPSH